MQSGIIRAVVIVEFPESTPEGHEQTGERPAVVVGVPDLLAQPRYGGLLVVPCSSKLHQFAAFSPAMYPVLSAGAGGLTRDSVAICEQLRFISRTRVIDYLGHLTPDEYRPIDAAIRIMLNQR